MGESARHESPVPKSAAVRRRMQQQRRAGTAPELQIRSQLHRAGMRFRVGATVPGMPRRTIDIAFPKARIAVFVDGCYWHRCPVHHVNAKNNAEWWTDKMSRNVRRDQETTAHLESLGWTVLRFWEHEDPASAVETVRETWSKWFREAQR